MKKFLFILFFTTTLFPQDWEPINRTYRTWFQSIYFSSDNCGWICGVGIIFKLNPSTMIWENQSVPQGAFPNYIGFFNDDVGIAAGDNGSLIRTLNGGTNWQKMNLGIGANFNRVQIFNQDIAYIAGDSGIILKTNNKGQTWSYTNPPDSNRIQLVYFATENVGFSVSKDLNDISNFYRTSNGGLTWELEWSYPYINNKGAIQFFDSLNGYAAIDYGISKTTNGGVTWTSHFNVGKPIHDIHFIDSLNGVIVGGSNNNYTSFLGVVQNGVYRTIWYEFEGYDRTACFITPNGTGWAVGWGGSIYHSYDGINGWSRVYSGEDNIHSAAVSNEGKFYLVGNNNNFGYQYEVFYKSYNNKFFKNVSGELSSVDPIPNLDVFMVDSLYGYLLYDYNPPPFRLNKTTNGGYDFNAPVNQPPDFNLNKIYFINKDEGWVCGNKINYTSDGGINWETQSSLAAPYKVTDFISLGNSIFFALATNFSYSKMLKKNNINESWVEYQIPYVNSLYGIFFKDENNGVVVGNSNSLIKTTNGGITWQKISVENSVADNYNDVLYLNDNIFIASEGSKILSSTDNGQSWEIKQIGFPVKQILYDGSKYLLARASNNVYLYEFYLPIPVELISFTATRKNDKIYLNWTTATETNNKGFIIEKRNDNKWIEIDFIAGKGNSTEINNYSYVDKIIPGNKTFYRLKQIDFSGEISFSKEVESEYEILNYTLEQNYPNPFNPSTKIKYQVPRSSLIKIIIFDVLGNEVKTLVNETQKAGVYEVEFNAEKLSSGIYFCKLIADNFASVKKMILMK